MRNPTRRAFLVTAAAAVPAFPRLSGLARAGGAPTPVERKDVRDLSSDELLKYREAVSRLKKRAPQRPKWADGQITLPDPAGMDKTGYAYQALVHTFNCPHHNWWFLPWHRAYLFTFEQILRASVADFLPDVPVAIPYWNWTEQMTIPQEFTENPDTNPLYDERRFSVPLTDEDVGPGTIIRTVDQAPDFSTFGSYPACGKRDLSVEGPFESGPHDTVHGSVGGTNDPDNPDDPSTLGTMSKPQTSAFDPIFWSHHANLDRLWNVWLGQTGHANPGYDAPCPDQAGAATWGGMVFDEFVKPDGTPMSRTAKDFLEDAAVKAVTYKSFGTPLARLEGRALPAEKSAAGATVLAAEVAATAPRRLEPGKPVTLTVAVPPEARAALVSARARPAPPVRFQLDGVNQPAAFPRARVRAFLNNPKADATTSYKDPSYIGYFAFFDASHAKDHGGASAGTSYSLNLTPVLQRLGNKVTFDKPLTVTLVMVEKEGPGAALNARRAAPGPATFEGGKLLIGK